MSLICQYCEKVFKGKNTLDFHQKNTRSCLEKQGKNNESYKCQYCNKILSTHLRLNTHLDVCKVKLKKKKEEKEQYNSILEKEMEEYKSRIKEKEEYNSILVKEAEEYKIRLKELDIKLKEKEEYILKLEEMLEKATNSIVEIAKQPKHNITNTNSNNSRIKTQNIQNNNFDINDIQKISNVLENHLTPEVLRKGQKGVAEMLKTHLLQTDKGDLLYGCTDVARQKFEFVNKDGLVEVDSKATKLLISLNKANIYDKTQTTCQKLWEKEDGTVDSLAQLAYMQKISEILGISSDSSKLRAHLASITCK